MSDSITIKEGGASRAFGPVSRMRVLKQGTGTEDFVPESGTTLTTKSVTENGVYPATQDNAYGYSQVSVNCSQEADSLTGKKQDGNEYTVSRDGDGNIQEDKVPSALLIVLAPLKNAYNDGETIDLTGIVAVAVDGNDQPWTGGGRYPDGIIPIDELILPVNTAYYDPSGEPAIPEHQDSGSITVSRITSTATMVSYALQASPIGYTMSSEAQETLNQWISNNSDKAVFARYDTVRSGSGYGAFAFNAIDLKIGETINLGSYKQGTSRITFWFANDSGPYHITRASVQTGDNQKLYIGEEQNTATYPKPIEVSPINGYEDIFAKEMEVTVQWRRPGDGKMLSDSYLILVSTTT